MKHVLVFEQKGDVNQVYAVINSYRNKVNTRTTSEKYIKLMEKDKKAILDCLRNDREQGLVGCENNPSKDSRKVNFLYNPTFHRQDIANNLPYRIAPTITVIDSFACLGSRFGLEPLQVFVEVCQSNCGNERIWAHIFYVADSEIPASTIVVKQVTIYEKKM